MLSISSLALGRTKLYTCSNVRFAVFLAVLDLAGQHSRRKGEHCIENPMQEHVRVGFRTEYGTYLLNQRSAKRKMLFIWY